MRTKTTFNTVVIGIGIAVITLLALVAILTKSPKSDSYNKEHLKESSQDGDWCLTLVNPWNEMDISYTPKLHELNNGQAVDERCYDSLQRMMDDCRAQGLSPVICSSYRSQETQTMLYDNKVSRLTDEGLSPDEAFSEAGKTVALPGTSEHQLGLSLDIVDLSNQELDESQEKTAVTQWMIENCYKYGFILRYPSDKSEITGIIYEPWHYRYVGKDAAEYIFRNGICLEEYLEIIT